MAKSLLLQNVKNKIPFFKNVSTNFIFLAALFILSIIIYYMYNKNSLENMDNDRDKIVEGASLMGGLANAINRRNAANTTANAAGR